MTNKWSATNITARILLFPSLGMIMALLIRPSEKIQHPDLLLGNSAPVIKILSLPDGQELRFIQLPNTSFSLGEIEVPSSILSTYAGETESFKGATKFVAWLSEQTGKHLRLPEVDEWNLAARGGFEHAEFAWGFGPLSVPKGVHFGLDRAPVRPGKAFGYGFRDMAGGLWEWTREGILLGSAWSERRLETLRLSYAFHPQSGYHNQDTGIRVLWVHHETSEGVQ